MGIQQAVSVASVLRTREEVRLWKGVKGKGGMEELVARFVGEEDEEDGEGGGGFEGGEGKEDNEKERLFEERPREWLGRSDLDLVGLGGRLRELKVA